VAALVEPEDSTVSIASSLLPQRLNINCQDDRPYFWDAFLKRYREDKSRIRLRLTNVFAKNGEVTVQPIVANDLSSPLFLPDNFGALGHYDVTLYAGSTRLPYTHKNAPRDEGRRIYEKEDILPVVPKKLERLEPSKLVVGDSIEEGTTIHARVSYTFSPDDTLQATSETTFPSLNLDSLQTPIFDTLRTDGEVYVPDSLVLQRDTTTMRVVGIDTTVTRSGYTLFSTRRDGNAASNAEEARNLLYVPDSVIARARRDSLRAIAQANTTVPTIDTTTISPGEAKSPLQIVERTNTFGLRSLIAGDRLVQLLSKGLPDLDVSADSLLSLSEAIQDAYVQPPSLSERKTQRGLITKPDSLRDDSVLLSAPESDSLFQMFRPDTLVTADTFTTVDSLLAADTLTTADTLITADALTTADTLTTTDTLTADTLAGVDTTALFTELNPFVSRDLSERVASTIDSIAIDSLHRTVGPKADSVATTSIVSNTLSNPPRYSYWYAARSVSRNDTPLLVLDPSFSRLRASSRIDTTTIQNLTGLLPDRVGLREQKTFRRYPQQVIKAPTGTYRKRYLTTWKTLQENSLKQHYCDIFPFPLQSGWKSTSMY